MKVSKYKSTIAILLLSVQLQAQNLHFLSVINTDNYARPDRRVDAENINKIATNISKYMNLTKYTYDFGDSTDFNPQTVRLTLQSLKITPCSDDVVWFHYSGLGGNYGAGSAPTMRLFGGDLEVNEVENILRQKKPKLLLISIDCANTEIKSRVISNKTEQYTAIKRIPSAIKAKLTVVPSNEIPYFQLIENYNKLFKKFNDTKVVLIFSSLKGEDALSDTRKGSFWIQAFSKAFSDVVNGTTQKEIWEKDISNKMQTNLVKLSNGAQHSLLTVSPNARCEDE